MAINIEKILTISAREWFEMNNKEPWNYEARGVHRRDSMLVINDFAEKVPSEAEVVVEYRFAVVGYPGSNEIYAAGTALIPKKIASTI